MSFLFHFGDLLLDGKEPVDDSVDKIHRRLTIVFLLILSLPLFTKQFAGEPIECFTPTYFTEAQSRYVNSYCWTVSTFYVEGEEADGAGQVPKSTPVRVHSVDYDEYDAPTVANNKRGHQVKVSYYQWAPIILLAKALTFYIPFALWKGLAQNHGISLRHLMKRVTLLTQINAGHPDRNVVMAEVLDYMRILIRRTPDFPSQSCGSLDRLGCGLMALLGLPRARLFVTFMIVKLLYLLNVMLQFYLLVSFLGDDYLTHGFDILAHLWNNNEWWSSPRFPLQTLCSVRAAQQGSLRHYMCHCVLPINLFNEKICSVWWFYLVALFPVTAICFFRWVVRSSGCSRLAFVQHYLWRTGQVANEEIPKESKFFLVEHLDHDGVFILRLIEINHGSTILTQIVAHLYAHFQRSQQQQNRGENPSLIRDPILTQPDPAPPAAEPNSREGTSNMNSNNPFVYLWANESLRQGSLSSRHEKPFRRLHSRRSLPIHPSSIV